MSGVNGSKVRAVARAVFACGSLWGASAASAAPVQVTFASTGAEQTFFVPVGIHSLHIVAIGAAGGGGASGAAGGIGGRAEADVPVSPGQTLYIEVGGNGTDGAIDGTGGFNGGGHGGASGFYPGGGGGGASDVRTVPAAQPESLASRLLIAAGGGAGGGADFAGAGGAAGQPGGNGGATGGGAGASLSGGTAGTGPSDSPTAPATDGSLGTGGKGASTINMASGGGAGGGGLFGGGGGGSATSAAGGGGGSSYADPSLANVALSTSGAASSVTITYDPGPHTVISPSQLTFLPQLIGTTSAPSSVTVSNDGATSLTVSGVSTTGDNAGEFASDGGCSAPLAPNASCTLLVRFTPQGAGQRNATLLIATNAPGSPAAVALAGTGQAVAGPPAGSPSLGSVSLSPRRFRAGRGTTIVLTAVDATSIKFVVKQKLKGVRSGKRCVARSRKHPKGKRCTRLLRRGSFSAAVSGSTARVHFSGIVKGKRLRPGTYSLAATPVHGTASGQTRTASFAVLRASGA